MELNVTNISYELDNEEGLSSIFFEYEGGYFTIAKMEDEENIYLEKDDQSNGQYFDPDCFEFSLRNGIFSLSINLNNKRIIRYLEDNGLNVDLYGSTALVFEPYTVERLKEISNVLDRIFQ